jgi:hypothetical protein
VRPRDFLPTDLNEFAITEGFYPGIRRPGREALVHYFLYVDPYCLKYVIKYTFQIVIICVVYF